MELNEELQFTVLLPMMTMNLPAVCIVFIVLASLAEFPGNIIVFHKTIIGYTLLIYMFFIAQDFVRYIHQYLERSHDYRFSMTIGLA